MTDTRCPLYKSARTWAQAAVRPHAGLVFDKFADAWTIDRAGNFEFDKPNPADPGGWLRRQAGKKGDKELLREACERQSRMVTALGGRVWRFTNSSRFVTGLGRQHPIENGFAWHPTLGVPYLPGSSLKGVLRSWEREEKGTWDPHRENNWKESQSTKERFGDQGSCGRLLVLDMLPTGPPELVVDIMTPHYGPYYQDGKTPGDWHSPVPISFLVVERGASWQVALLPGSRDPVLEDDWKEIEHLLSDALQWEGAGAKTSVGYGRFQRDRGAEEKLKKVAEELRAATEKQQALDRKLSSLSPELKALVLRAEEEGWKDDSGSFQDGIERYLSEHPSLTQDCAHWVRDNCFEIFWPGIWAEPDQVKGKKKKRVHKQRRADLVKRIRGAE